VKALLLLAAPAVAHAGPFVEAGWSQGVDHGDGVWRQKHLPSSVDLSSPAFGIGYRWGSWSISYRRVAASSSEARALTNDVDYDPGAGACRANCDQVGTFITRGRVDAIAVGYEHRFSNGILLSADAIAYAPTFSVSLRDFRSRDLATGIPYGPVAADYKNEREVRPGVALGVGYEAGSWAVILRGYPSIQSAGDERTPDGTSYRSLSSLLSKAVTVTVRYSF